MKWNENRYKGRRDSVSKMLKLLFICSLLLFVSNHNGIILSEGFIIFDSVNSSLLKEGERGSVLCEQDGFLYLKVDDSSPTDSIQIVDVQQPESSNVVGRYELAINETLMDFKISENTAYLLKRKSSAGIRNWTVTLLNITEPTNPVLLGSTVAENIIRVSPNPWYLSIHNNYTYVNTDYWLIIFDCSNPSFPMKVANHTSSGGELHVNNDFLYLVSTGIKIYGLADPVNPLLLGELNSTKNTIAGSGVYGDYVINTFWWSGIQVYNCTDPVHPTISWDYKFPNWDFHSDGNIHDMDIFGDKLFAGGNKLYIFDLSNPQNLKRIARINIGDQAISKLTVSEDHIYLTFHSNIKIYSYGENSLGRNFGIAIGIGLVIIVGSILILRKKKNINST